MNNEGEGRHYLVTVEMSVWAENAVEADNFVNFLLGDQDIDSVTIEPHPGFEDPDNE